jgi:hypothetical protein
MPTIENALRTLKGIPSGAHPKGARQAGRPAAGVLAILTLASVGLAACGGSSSGTASNASAAPGGASRTTTSTTGGSSPTTATSQPGAPATAQSRFPVIRTCLQKNGITLPPPTRGGSAGGLGAFLRAGGAGGPRLPKGVTRAQFQAALKKCGAGNVVRAFGPNGPGSRPAGNPVFRQALSKYAECLRQNGVKLPAPDTSGKGPIFSTKGLNTSSPQFRAATMKCRATLIGAFRRLPRANGTAGAGGGSSPAGR